MCRHNSVYAYMSKVAVGRISVERMQLAHARNMLQRARRRQRKRDGKAILRVGKEACRREGEEEEADEGY